MRFAVVRCRHDRSWETVPCRIGRAHRGLRGDYSGGRRNGPEPEAKRRAAAIAEDGEGRLFCFAMQSAPFNENMASHHWRAAENSRAQPLPGRAACRPIAL